MYNNYLKQIAFILSIFAIPLGCNWLFLFNSGELMPVEKMVERQLKSPEYCIVGLATRNQGYYYKKAMYHHIQPKILLLGSSRVMQFRNNFFKAPMLGVGGAMNSINEGFSLVQELLTQDVYPKQMNFRLGGKCLSNRSVYKIHDCCERHEANNTEGSAAKGIPEVIIWGLDYWWFNENEIKPVTDIKPPQALSHKISLRSYLLPFLWLWQNKISFTDYFNQIHPRHLIKKNFAQGIGVDGLLNRSGFGPDGSYFYTKFLIGKEKHLDEHFLHTLNVMNERESLYPLKINEAHFQHFLKMFNYIQSRGSKIILFIPPLAPTVAESLEKHPHTARFIDDLRYRLTQAGITFYDFHHPKTLGGNCEFIDGLHGGEVLYAKMLLKMMQTESDLIPYVNLSYLMRVSEHLKDLAMVPQQYITPNAEIDFLKIGCNKIQQASWR